MAVGSDTDDLVRRKVLSATDALQEARDRVHAALAGDPESRVALGRQAAQARHHSDELLRDAGRLIARAERLIAEAKAIQEERQPDTSATSDLRD